MRVQRTHIVTAVALLALSSACKRQKKSAGESGQAAESSSQNSSVISDGPLEPRSYGEFGTAEWLRDSRRVVAWKAGDTALAAVARVGSLTVYEVPSGTVRGKIERTGTPQILELVDGDDGPLLWAGWGMSAATRSAAMLLERFDAASLESRGSIKLEDSTRQQLVDLSVGPKGQLVIAYFRSKYQVLVAEVDRKTLTTKKLDEVRMLTAVDSIYTEKGPARVYARMYGDKKGEHGGAYLVADGMSAELPTVRGARAGAWHEPTQTYVVADGWHREYAAKAEGRITAIAVGRGGARSTVLANVEGRRGYTRLTFGDIDGAGGDEVVATGDGPAVAVSLAAGGPTAAWVLGGDSITDAAAVDVDGDGADEIILAGTSGGIWRRPR